MFKWETGEQGGGYETLTLLKVGDFEIRLIKLKEGKEIYEHVDSCCPTKRLHQAIFVLKKAKKGGRFVCKDAIINLSRFIYYLPMIMEHKATKIIKGVCFMLFISWCLERKE